jgi:hypothetical protein
MRNTMALLALAACAQGAQAAYAGLWFQCQPRWNAEKNYLLVEVQPGEKAWNASWGASDTAHGATGKDKDGNLLLRGCHARGGTPATNCDPAKPPVFATLPKGVADGKGLPAAAALARGGWIRTDKAGLDSFARRCAALRPQGKG